MTEINESEFARICQDIYDERETIWKHNPVGTNDVILLWMLLSCLTSYLSLSDKEMPCFSGVPDGETYRQAILFVVKNNAAQKFDAGKYLDKLLKN